MTGTLGEAIAWWGIERPGERAIVLAGEPFTFAQIHRWTDAVAKFLQDKGVVRGDRIGIFAFNAIEWCAAAYGIVKAGAVLVPLNYRYQARK